MLDLDQQTSRNRRRSSWSRTSTSTTTPARAGQGRERRVVLAAARRAAGPDRRIRLGQDHHGDGADAPDPPPGRIAGGAVLLDGQDILTMSAARAARDAAARHRADPAGRDELAQPGDAARGPDDRRHRRPHGRGMTRAELDARVAELLTSVGPRRPRSRAATRTSCRGGMKQRA